MKEYQDDGALSGMRWMKKRQIARYSANFIVWKRMQWR
jgi:hypothetical protein